MKILAIEKEVDGITKEQIRPFLKAEAQRACTNENEARNILDTLPLVKEKLITFDLLPLVPYDGLARLFEN